MLSLRVHILISIVLSSTVAFQVSICNTNLGSSRYKELSYLHGSSESEYSMDGFDQFWMKSADMKSISHENGNDLDLFSAIHADVTYYDQDCMHPMLYRLRKPMDGSIFVKDESRYMEHTDISNRVNDAINQTLRWCLNFVQELNLCPWAKLSLKDKMAIRLKVVEQELGIDCFESIIRESAKELIRITDEGYVDENVAITFVIALPAIHDGNCYDFEFDNFYDFSVDLEDRLFDEAEESSDNSNIQIGDEITIAPFHPDWAFASDSGDIELEAVDFEKRSPLPTISLVKSLVIERAGEEATTRIGLNNEMTLQKHGVEWLKYFYNENVKRDGK